MRLGALGVVVFVVGLLSWPSPASAQPVVSGTEHLTSDRPEAWAVKYFTSTTLLTGSTVPGQIEPGSILIGGELVWIPFLTTEQRRVGFRGTKVEDLNKAPFFVRPRVTIGLPGNFATTVGIVPPVETFGVTARLVAIALERPIYATESWAAGWRVYGQTGRANAAFTCFDEALAFPARSPENPVGCLETSSDVATLRYVGVEFSIGQETSRGRLAPHGAIAVNYLENKFEVDSRRINAQGLEFIDRTMQRSSGATVAATGGIGIRLTDRLEASLDVFYTPLWVRRPADSVRKNDGLLNAKALVRYRLR